MKRTVPLTESWYSISPAARWNKEQGKERGWENCPSDWYISTTISYTKVQL